VPGLLSVTSGLGQALGQLQEVGQSAAAVTREIVRARQAFWASYPDKPGSAAAAVEFHKQLFGKDLIYMSQSLLGENPLVALKLLQIDGGIPARAQPEFNAWVAAVRKAMFTKSNGRQEWRFSDLTTANMLAALEASQGEYDRYSLERDWAEFTAARREPAWVKTPDQYIAMLYMRDHDLSRDEAVRAATAFVQVFGARIAEPIRRVRAARMDPDGTLEYYALAPLGVTTRLNQSPDSAAMLLRARSVVPEGTTLVESERPLDVIVGLMTKGAPDVFAHDLAMRHVARAKHGATWIDARAAYEQLVAAHGAARVRDVAATVQGAPRYHDGSLANPGALGVGDADDPYDALLRLVAVRSGERPAAAPKSPPAAAAGASTAAATAANPVHTAWSWVRDNSGWVDFWELVGGVRRRDPMIEHNRVFGMTEGGQVALQIVHSMIHAGKGRSAERSSAVLYPHVGSNSGNPPSFLGSDSWPWTADVPGAAAASGIETLSINRKPLECHWWSLAMTGTNVIKIAWFNESVPGGLVRSYVRAADGTASDIIAVFIAQQRPTSDGSLLALLASRLGAPVGTAEKASGAPPPHFDGQNWTPPPRLPAGTRLRVALSMALAGHLAAVPATLKDPVVVNGAIVVPAGAATGVSFQAVPQPGRRGAAEPLGRFRFAGFQGGEVEKFEAVEVPASDAPDGGLHRKPVPAGTVLTFEVLPAKTTPSAAAAPARPASAPKPATFEEVTQENQRLENEKRVQAEERRKADAARPTSAPVSPPNQPAAPPSAAPPPTTGLAALAGVYAAGTVDFIVALRPDGVLTSSAPDSRSSSWCRPAISDSRSKERPGSARSFDGTRAAP
jgi:hypothetical protein